MGLAEYLEKLSQITPTEEKTLPPFFRDLSRSGRTIIGGLGYGEKALGTVTDAVYEYLTGIPSRDLWKTSTTQSPKTLETALAQPPTQPSAQPPTQPSLSDVKEAQLDAMNAADRGYGMGTPEFNALIKKGREAYNVKEYSKPLDFWNVGDKFYGGTKMPTGSELEELRKDVKKPTAEETNTMLKSIMDRRRDDEIYSAQKEAEEAIKIAAAHRGTSTGKQFIADAMIAVRNFKTLQGEKLRSEIGTQAKEIAEIGVKKTELAQKQKEKELSARIVSQYQIEQTKMMGRLNEAQKALTDVPNKVLDPKAAAELTKGIQGVIAQIQQTLSENEDRMIALHYQLGITPPEKKVTSTSSPKVEDYRTFITPKGAK